jgi:hypothetical protein
MFPALTLVGKSSPTCNKTQMKEKRPFRAVFLYCLRLCEAFFILELHFLNI